MKNGMQKRFGKTVSTVRKSHSRMLAACRRGNSVQLDSSRCGAGSIAWVVHRTGFDQSRAKRGGRRPTGRRSFFAASAYHAGCPPRTGRRPGAPVGVLW